jgi:hypothetical protein
VTGTINITVSTPFSASVTRVDYILDGSLVAVTNPALFSLRWDSTQYADGTHTLRVKAYDSAGGMSESGVSFSTQNRAK